MTTPPGWYPDPGQTGNGPALERWWDGKQWTEYTRAAQGTPVPGALGAGYPPYPGGEVISGGASDAGRRGKLVVGVIAAVVVVACVVGGVVALTGGGSDANADAARPSTAPSGAPFGNGGPDGGGSGGSGGGLPNLPSGAPTATADPGYVLDRLDGIQLPVPDGWKSETDQYGLANLTTGTYACPGDSSKSCVRGGVNSYPTEAFSLKATTAEAAAKEDITQNAEDSYGSDVYGGITSHQQLKSEKVTVAGEAGYLVRWKVVTKDGDDGYVQSVVFPAPGDSSRLVLVRYGFDINAKAPKLAVMDQITEGIKSAGTNGTGV